MQKPDESHDKTNTNSMFGNKNYQSIAPVLLTYLYVVASVRIVTVIHSQVRG
jgi:hypothetical protein